MKSVLVTGGCGFVGANLVPMLLEKGYRVRVLDNLSRGSRDYLPEHERLEVFEGDIRNSSDIAKALVDIWHVIHLAAYGSVVESVKDPVENFDINANGTFQLLNGCRQAPVKSFVFASTGGALIGNAVPPVNENSPPRPISPYGASKLCGEAYCSAFAGAYGLSVTALRFANVIGPSSWHKKGAVTAFMKCIWNNQPITIYGDGEATRDFLYVEDLCNGIIAAFEAELPGFNVMHLASAREVSIKELAEVIRVVAKATDRPIDFKEKRRGEVERNFANFDHARALIGFEPKVELEEAIERTWEWFTETAARA